MENRKADTYTKGENVRVRGEEIREGRRGEREQGGKEREKKRWRNCISLIDGPRCFLLQALK